MVDIKSIKNLAKKLGAKVTHERDGETWALEVQAPYGKVWADGDLHYLLNCEQHPWKPDYADMESRMKFGLVDCEDDECEWCADIKESR